MGSAWSYSPPMDAGVLGPLRIQVASGEVPITGAKERTVLAHLVARVGQVVPAEEMVDALWPDDPPRTAHRTLQSYVARVRSALDQGGAGAGLIVTEGRGYRLVIDPGDVDAHRFVRLVELGRSAAADGQPGAAAETLSAALALWRGPAYAGFESTVFGRAEGRRLGQLRLAVVEDWLEARVSDGGAAEAVPELEAHVTENPLRERGWALLARAYAAADNQAAALDALDRARRVLADELGVDPGEELRTLQARVLAHDRSLRPRSALPAALVPPATALVGRAEELAALQEQWRLAAAGTGRRVLLLGDAGSGRWRLAGEIALTAHGQGAAVLLGAATGPGQGPVLRVVDARDGAAGEVGTPVDQELQLVVAGVPPMGMPADAEVRTCPLTVDQVREVLVGYLPDGVGAEDVQAAAWEIHERSGGNVGRTRDLAVRWARQAVAQRVAERTARSSGTAVAHEAERSALADDVLRWSALRPALDVDHQICPWRGLASYDEGDAPWFAGRERLAAELVARIGAERALLLVGGSGAGKSSLLRAGLLAALAAGALPGSASWVRIVLRPGEHPMRELTEAALVGAGSTGPDRVADLLARSLDGRGGAERILLVIDQFEECWTVCADPGEREAFLATVADLAQNPHVPVTLVIAVRADHAGSIASHSGIADALAGRSVFVGPMGEGELRRAIEGPAARAGLTLDTGLADALVADTLAEPGGLPLLSTALADLWAQRVGARLTLGAYVGSGGVGAAIARMAERAYAELDGPHQRAARVLLRRLAGPGQGDGVVRRRVSLTELEALPDPLVRACVEPLARDRLLMVSDGHVEVAHEALFRSWPRLRDWLAEDASARDGQRRLTVAAAEWDREGREPGGLWGGARLASAVELVATRPEEFTGLEVTFVEAGTAKLDAERADAEQRARVAQKQNTRLRRVLAGLGITLAMALVAGGLAILSRNEADAQRTHATAQRLAATAISEDYLADRMLTAVEAVRTQASPQTVGALLSVLDANPAIVDRIDTPNRLLGAASAPGSSTAVAVANIEDVHLFDMTTGEDRVVFRQPDANLLEVRMSPDGRFTAFADASWAGRRPARLTVLDTSSGEVVWTRDMEDDPGGVVMMGGWDFTGTPGELAVATVDGLDLVRVDGSAAERRVAWEPVDPQWMRLARVSAGRVVRFATDTLPAQIIDLSSGATRELPGVGGFGFVSPDGLRLATQSAGPSPHLAGPVLIFDITDPAAKPVEVPVEGELGGAAFTTDGGTVVLGSMTGSVVVADPVTGEVRETFSGGHNGAILGVVVTPDGRTAWTAGRDGDLIAWDLSGQRRLAVGRDLPLAVTSGQVSADGRRAAVWAENPPGVPAQAGVMDLASGDLITGPFPRSGEPGELPSTPAAGITPDGANLLVGAVAGPEDPAARLQVVDVASGEVRHDTALPWWPNGIAASADGTAAIVAGVDGVVRIDLSTGQVTATRDLPEVNWYTDGQSTVEPSPDGQHVAVARESQVVILDVVDLHEVAAWPAGDYEHVLAMKWLDGGRALAYGGRLGKLATRSFPDGTLIGEPRLAFPGFLLDITASPDGALLALMGSDGEVLLWDTAAQQPIGQPLVPARDSSGRGWVRFTPDGAALEVLYDSRRAYRYQIDTDALLTRACVLAAREPTPAEWASMHGDTPQQPTCGARGEADLLAQAS